jgi:hypothetical protein
MRSSGMAAMMHRLVIESWAPTADSAVLRECLRARQQAQESKMPVRHRRFRLLLHSFEQTKDFPVIATREWNAATKLQ